MGKTVADIAKSLKLKAEPKDDLITLRLGVRKHTLPFEVRFLQSDEYVFVHIPPTAAIFRKEDEGLIAVEDDAEAAKAASSFRQSRKRSSRKAQDVSMPEELQAALKKIPSGYKLAYDADGTPRLVKRRKRGKQAK